MPVRVLEFREGVILRTDYWGSQERLVRGEWCALVKEPHWHLLTPERLPVNLHTKAYIYPVTTPRRAVRGWFRWKLSFDGKPAGYLHQEGFVGYRPQVPRDGEHFITRKLYLYGPGQHSAEDTVCYEIRPLIVMRMTGL